LAPKRILSGNGLKFKKIPLLKGPWGSGNPGGGPPPQGDQRPKKGPLQNKHVNPKRPLNNIIKGQKRKGMNKKGTFR